MADNKFLQKLSAEQMDFSSRIFDLALSRVLSKAYSDFDEKTKDDMKTVFGSGPKGHPDEEKEKFIKKNISNFEKLFKEELKKIENDIKEEIERII